MSIHGNLDNSQFSFFFFKFGLIVGAWVPICPIGIVVNHPSAINPFFFFCFSRNEEVTGMSRYWFCVITIINHSGEIRSSIIDQSRFNLWLFGKVGHTTSTSKSYIRIALLPTASLRAVSILVFYHIIDAIEVGLPTAPGKSSINASAAG